MTIRVSVQFTKAGDLQVESADLEKLRFECQGRDAEPLELTLVVPPRPAANISNFTVLINRAISDRPVDKLIIQSAMNSTVGVNVNVLQTIQSNCTSASSVRPLTGLKHLEIVNFHCFTQAFKMEFLENMLVVVDDSMPTKIAFTTCSDGCVQDSNFTRQLLILPLLSRALAGRCVESSRMLHLVFDSEQIFLPRPNGEEHALVCANLAVLLAKRPNLIIEGFAEEAPTQLATYGSRGPQIAQQLIALQPRLSQEWVDELVAAHQALAELEQSIQELTRVPAQLEQTVVTQREKANELMTSLKVNLSKLPRTDPKLVRKLFDLALTEGEFEVLHACVVAFQLEANQNSFELLQFYEQVIHGVMGQSWHCILSEDNIISLTMIDPESKAIRQPLTADTIYDIMQICILAHKLGDRLLENCIESTVDAEAGPEDVAGAAAVGVTAEADPEGAGAAAVGVTAEVGPEGAGAAEEKPDTEKHPAMTGEAAIKLMLASIRQCALTLLSNFVRGGMRPGDPVLPEAAFHSEAALTKATFNWMHRASREVTPAMQVEAEVQTTATVADAEVQAAVERAEFGMATMKPGFFGGLEHPEADDVKEADKTRFASVGEPG